MRQISVEDSSSFGKAVKAEEEVREVLKTKESNYAINSLNLESPCLWIKD